MKIWRLFLREFSDEIEIPIPKANNLFQSHKLFYSSEESNFFSLSMLDKISYLFFSLPVFMYKNPSRCASQTKKNFSNKKVFIPFWSICVWALRQGHLWPEWMYTNGSNLKRTREVEVDKLNIIIIFFKKKIMFLFSKFNFGPNSNWVKNLLTWLETSTTKYYLLFYLKITCVLKSKSHGIFDIRFSTSFGLKEVIKWFNRKI